MMTIVVVDRHDIARASEALGIDAAPVQGETMRLIQRPNGTVDAVIYADTVVDTAIGRIGFALCALLDRMRDLDDERRWVVIDFVSKSVDRTVADIEQGIASVDTYLHHAHLNQEEFNGDNGDNYHLDA